jgi:hypothetical protein
MMVYCWTLIHHFAENAHHHVRRAGHRRVGHHGRHGVLHSAGPRQAAAVSQTVCIYTGAFPNPLATWPQEVAGRNMGGAPGGSGLSGRIGSALIKTAGLAALGSTLAGVGVASFVGAQAFQGSSSPAAVLASSIAEYSAPNGAGSLPSTSGQPVHVPEPASVTVLATSMLVSES